MPIVPLRRDKTPTHNECPRDDTKLHRMVRHQSWSFREWGKFPILQSSLLPGPLRSGLVVPIRIQSMGQSFTKDHYYLLFETIQL